MGKQYHTSDTAETAYLISHEVRLVNTDASNPEVEFLLEEKDEGQIGQLLIEWESFSAPERKFYKVYRWLLTQIKKNNNGKKN